MFRFVRARGKGGRTSRPRHFPCVTMVTLCRWRDNAFRDVTGWNHGVLLPQAEPHTNKVTNSFSLHNFEICHIQSVTTHSSDLCTKKVKLIVRMLICLGYSIFLFITHPNSAKLPMGDGLVQSSFLHWKNWPLASSRRSYVSQSKLTQIE